MPGPLGGENNAAGLMTSLTRAGGGDLSGSVPSGERVQGVLDLTLSDAVARGLKYNFGAVSGELSTRRATAARLAELSNLLPNLNGRIVYSSQQVNLKAFGFGGFPGIPAIVGPFEVLDVRAALNQAIVDIRAWSNWKASREAVRSAELTNRSIRDSIVLVVVNLYLGALAGRARITSAEAQVATAQAEFRQASNMKEAGTVAGIDVLRAQVQLRAEEQRVIALRNDFERQKLDLARAIGLHEGQQFTLATAIPTAGPTMPELEDALRQARDTRPDYQASLATEKSAEWQRRAATSARIPALYFSGDFGTIGPSVRDTHATYAAAVGLQFPIFEGGRIRAAIERSSAELAERRAETADFRGRIDYQVRTAFLNVNAARERVAVAEEARRLAGEQLVQARDRFAAGVTNNLEVVQSQQAVAVAEENYIESLYVWNLSRAAVGYAVGRAQQIPGEFLGVTTP